MPLGNGDLGANLWVEPSGDIVFYLSKSDAWSENIRLLKLGRVRLRFSPNPLAAGAPFEQTLDAGSGSVSLRLGKLTARAWADANRPVFAVEAECPEPVAATVEVELWRTAPRVLSREEAVSAYGLHDGPEPVISEVDHLLPPRGGRIVWYHRNERSPYPMILRLQGLDSFLAKAPDPLLHLTFGGMLRGDGFHTTGDTTLAAAPARRHRLEFHALTAQTATVAAWEQALDQQVAATGKLDAGAWEAHRAWWRRFWERSWIEVSGAPDAAAVTRGYALQRLITACAGRGAYPIKFNGSLFTVDSREPNRNFDADFRAWGAPYWFQNTRLPYWGMYTAGDFDLAEPLYRMFLRALPLATERVRLYYGIGGASFPETMYFFGAYTPANYGWQRAGKHPSWVDNPYIRHYVSGGIELVAMLLEHHSHTRDRAFLAGRLLPLARHILTYYDQRFPRGADGKLRIAPAGALENHTDVVDPLPEIAGLRWVLPRLAALDPDPLFPRLLAAVPELPEGERDGRRVLLPAREILSRKQNSENPELYGIFPYRLFGLGKPGLELARATFDARALKEYRGWRQDAIQAALLGLTGEARRAVSSQFSTPHPGSRFPAFWGPNFDWIPDQDHGSVAVIALQRMLLQTDGDALRLFPAWPKNWDVRFRLHAPGNTTLSGVWREGKLERLEVEPASRRAQLTIGEPQ
jgi:hypothetical protein